MAAFVVEFGLTPDQFYSLTRAEYLAIIEAHNRKNRR